MPFCSKPQSAAHASHRAQPTQATERSKCKNDKITGLLRLFTNYYKAFAIYHAIMARCRQFITKWLQIRFVQNVQNPQLTKLLSVPKS